MCVKYPSHLVFNQNHRISFPYTTHFVFTIINDSYDFNFYNNYEAIRNQVDKRLFFGFTMTMTVVLKD